MALQVAKSLKLERALTEMKSRLREAKAVNLRFRQSSAVATAAAGQLQRQQLQQACKVQKLERTVAEYRESEARKGEANRKLRNRLEAVEQMMTRGGCAGWLSVHCL